MQYFSERVPTEKSDQRVARPIFAKEVCVQSPS